MMALRLNEPSLITEILENIPPKDSKCKYLFLKINTKYFICIIVELTVVSLPKIYVEKILKIIAICISTTRHIEFYVQWAKYLLTSHQPHQTTILNLQKNLSKKLMDLSKM